MMTVIMEEEELRLGDDSDDKSREKSTDVKIEYTIRDETAENPVVDEKGVRIVVMDEDKMRSFGSYIWENIIETLDYDYFDGIKNGTALKFVCDCDMTIKSTGESRSLKIVFDLNDGEFVPVGWTFQVDSGVGRDSIKSLDDKLEAWIKSVYSAREG